LRHQYEFMVHSLTIAAHKARGHAFTLKTRTSDDGRGDDAGLE
jgi:hypothetical protein